jgi:hypothetical protein
LITYLCEVFDMFSQSLSKNTRLTWLTALVLSGVIGAVAAENSTGIRLGDTDFGGKQTSRLGTSHDRQATDRSWSRTAPDQRSWSRDDHHRSGKNYHNDGKHSSSPQHRHSRYHGDRNLGGIQGHPSFGLSTTPKHRYRQHYDHGYYRPPAVYYSSPRVGVQVYTVPQVYSYGYQESYAPSGGSVIYDDSTNDAYVAETSINPWTALGEYQYHTARYAFEAQIQQQPHAALPRVGLALSTALAGQLDAAAFAMQDALLSDTSDLRFFNADPGIQLILEELLLSYEGDALMTASLHYLNCNYHAADRAVQVAANYCQPCTAVDTLNSLISAQL